MKKFLLSLVCCFCLLCSGCASTKNQVAYTVYPLGYLIQRLTGGNISQVSIQQDGIVQRAQIVDNYKEILESSDVLFHISDITPYMQIYAQPITATEVREIDLSSMNVIYQFQRYTRVLVENQETYVESPFYASDVFDTIDMNKKDFYLWTDPIAMISMARDMADYFVEAYPDDEKLIQDNFAKLESDLVLLDAEYQNFARSLVQQGKEVKVVTMTASFGSWQKSYGFQLYPVILSKYGVLPTEDQLKEIENRILQDNVKYIAYEPNMTEDMIVLFDRIREDMQLERIELNNLSSLTEEQKGENKDYLSLMYDNLEALKSIATQITSTESETPIESGKEDAGTLPEKKTEKDKQ